MAQTTDFLMYFRRIIKLHESMLKEICETYQLTMIEANIISFLYNNPGRDTARDIVELRMLSKGNVSQAVESLIQKGMLKRIPDQSDRRMIHLALLEKTDPIVQTMARQKTAFQDELFTGFSDGEKELYHQFNCRMMENAKSAMKRSETT
mgnify:CR=1 FL=1